MTHLQVDQPAPDFQLPDQTGTTHQLTDYRGQWVLLYFYPEDDTPGCTTEACGFRDNLPKFGELDAVVLGISRDTVKSHAQFATKYQLPFTILADPERRTLEAYGVWGPKKMMRREFLGTHRTSFLIDPAGKIAKIYAGVKPAIHPAEVLEDLKTLVATTSQNTRP